MRMTCRIPFSLRNAAVGRSDCRTIERLSNHPASGENAAFCLFASSKNAGGADNGRLIVFKVLVSFAIARMIGTTSITDGALVAVAERNPSVSEASDP